MRDLSKYTDEELQRNVVEIENKLHSDDRCQPMSGAEVAKLEGYLECYYHEIVIRKCTPAIIETLEEYSDAQLRQGLHNVLTSLAKPKLAADLRSDLEDFYLAIKYVLWRRERHECER